MLNDIEQRRARRIANNPDASEQDRAELAAMRGRCVHTRNFHGRCILCLDPPPKKTRRV